MRAAAAATRLWVLAATVLLAAGATSRDAQNETTPQVHRTLLGPFAGVAPSWHLKSSYQPRPVQAAPLVEVAGPRRVLRQATTESQLTIVILLLINFFAGFYTGYLRGFFT